MNAERAELPTLLPVFPLASAMLLPESRLPLNVFEPRYVQMFEDAMGGDRMIGMILPLRDNDAGPRPPLQRAGCAGRIVQMQASGDGRYFAVLEGVCRFEVVREMATDRLYRIVEPSWTRFKADLEPAPRPRIDRDELLANVRAYFDGRGLVADWRTIDDSDDEDLVNILSIVCPFVSTDKQLLLEASNLTERGKLVSTLMNMAILQGDAPETLQ